MLRLLRSGGAPPAQHQTMSVGPHSIGAAAAAPPAERDGTIAAIPIRLSVVNSDPQAVPDVAAEHVLAVGIDAKLACIVQVLKLRAREAELGAKQAIEPQARGVRDNEGDFEDSPIGTVLAELLMAQSGLGGLLAAAGNRFEMDRYFAVVIVLMALGTAITGLLRVAERRIGRWRTSLRDASR